MRAFRGGVLEPEVDGVHAELVGEFVEHAFAGEHGLRRAGRAVGGNARPVDDHLVALDEHVRHVVGREHAHGAGAERAARIGAGFVDELGVHGDDGAVALAADLRRVDRAGRRAGGAEHVLAGHHHLHRATALLGELERERFEVDGGLAAETAADLARDDTRMSPSSMPIAIAVMERTPKWPLGGTPNGRLAVLVEVADAGMGFDVALVHHGRGERTFDDHIGLGERGSSTSPLEMTCFLDQVGGRLRGLGQALGEQVVVQDRRIGRHRRECVRDRIKHLVVDHDRRGSRLCGLVGRRRDGGNCMAVIEDLVAGQQVVVEAFAAPAHLLARSGKVVRGDHRKNARHRLRRAGVDARRCARAHAGCARPCRRACRAARGRRRSWRGR